MLTRGNNTNVSDADKKSLLLKWIDENSTDTAANIASFKQIVSAMPQSEINSVYDFVFNHVKTGVPVVADSPLYKEITAISTKYNIFT